MEDQDYAEFIAKDTLGQVSLAVLIYAVALGLYWIFVG
jgi:hypothetical protein